MVRLTHYLNLNKLLGILWDNRFKKYIYYKHNNMIQIASNSPLQSFASVSEPEIAGGALLVGTTRFHQRK